MKQKKIHQNFMDTDTEQKNVQICDRQIFVLRTIQNWLLGISIIFH